MTDKPCERCEKVALIAGGFKSYRSWRLWERYTVADLHAALALIEKIALRGRQPQGGPRSE